MYADYYCELKRRTRLLEDSLNTYVADEKKEDIARDGWLTLHRSDMGQT